MIHFCPSPVRPVVLLQSDDWGRVGAPCVGSIDKLRQAGYPVGDSPWDFYGLESEHDLMALGDILLSQRDCDGRNAVMSAVFVMANADLARMQLEGYSQFRPISIKDGFPEIFEQTCLAGIYRALVENGAFYPALHGYTHFNLGLLVSIATEETDRGRRLRALHALGIPYLASLTPELNFALLDRSGPQEKVVCSQLQFHWIAKGVEIFQQIFDFSPRSTCAPGYRFNSYSCALWKKVGIQIVHTSKGVLGCRHGVWFTPRNVHFEPLLSVDAVESALLQVDAAVRRGYPVIISTHSINYIERHLGRAEYGRHKLLELLESLRRRYTDLRFTNELELVDSFRRNDEGWWRRPNMSELSERFRA